MRWDGGGGLGDGVGDSITGDGLCEDGEKVGVAAYCGAAHDTSEATIRMTIARGRLIAVTQSA
jgi:hypothetical protein